MNKKQVKKEDTRFDILFEKLSEAIKEQETISEFKITFDNQLSETIALFRDFQDEITPSQTTYLTRS